MRARAVAHPNIALVKYWGKRDVAQNLPATGSLSITLDSLWTKMSLELIEGAGSDTLILNGAAARNDGPVITRVSTCLDRILGAGRPRVAVTSESNFPMGAGLASSASAFAALVVAAARLVQSPYDVLSLARLAARSSGSAARSFYDGIVELRAGDDDIELHSIATVEEWPLRVFAAVTESGPKAVGSGEAMLRSAATSPFYTSWLERQDVDLEAARAAVREKDFEKLAGVSEHNCLKMHSVMWTSRPPVVYWNTGTLNAMETVCELRRAGVPVFFTIDAGPQVKAVCLPSAGEQVRAALAATAGVTEVLSSGLGRGARLLDDT